MEAEVQQLLQERLRLHASIGSAAKPFSASAYGSSPGLVGGAARLEVVAGDPPAPRPPPNSSSSSSSSNNSSLLAAVLAKSATARAAPPPAPLHDRFGAAGAGVQAAGRLASPAATLGSQPASRGVLHLEARPDPLAAFYSPGTTSHHLQLGISSPARLGGGGAASASGLTASGTGAAGGRWDAMHGLLGPSKHSSLPVTPRGRPQDGGDYNIPAFCSPSAPMLANAEDGLSVSLRLSALPGGHSAAQPPSRLGALCSATGEELLGKPASLEPSQPAPSSHSSSDWTEPSSSSLLDGLQTLLQQREREVQQLKCALLAAPAAQQLPGPSMECSILQSRVNELQAQLRLKDIEQQRTSTMAAELQRERDLLQEQLLQSRSEVESCQRQCRQAEAQRLEQEQASAQLQEALKSKEGAQGSIAAALGRLQGELEAERSGAEALRQKIRMLEAAVAQQKAEDVERLGAELQAAAKSSPSSSASSTKHRQEQQQQQQRDEQQKDGQQQQQQRIDELMAENQRLWSQYNLGQIEKVASQKKAEICGDRCRQAEARCQQLESELHAAEHESLAKDGQLEEARRQVSDLQARVKTLADQLAAANEQYERVQGALQAERQSNHQQRAHASASQQSEAALTAQMKTMATQIQHMQQDATALKAENTDLRQQLLANRSSLQDELAYLDQQAATLQQENNELQQQACQLASELEAKMKQMDGMRTLVKQLRADNAALQGSVRQHETEARQRDQEVDALQARVDSLSEESAQLQHELHESRSRVAELEASLAKSDMRSLQGSQAPSLRDVVGSMRSELQEKDLQLVQCSEELAAERRHVQELQRQVLDQAVEIDELQRQQSEAFSLRQQLAAARKTEAQLKKRVGELAQALAAAQHAQHLSSPGRGGACHSAPSSPVRALGRARDPFGASRALREAAAAAALDDRGEGCGSPSRPGSRLGSRQSSLGSGDEVAAHMAGLLPRGDLGFGQCGGGVGGGADSAQRSECEAGAAGGGSSSGGGGTCASSDAAEAQALRQELERVRRDRDRLSAECMALEGKVRILQAQATDAENWLMAP